MIDHAAIVHRISELERRMWQAETNCAGCPGSMTPQDFELDKFPLEPCPKRRRSDFDQPKENANDVLGNPAVLASKLEQR